MDLTQLPIVKRKWRCSPCVIQWWSLEKRRCKKCLKMPLHVRKNLMGSQRNAVLEKYKWRYVYCTERVKRGIKWWFHKKEFSIDHIIPISRGGKSVPSNLVLSCRSCNAKKGNRSLAMKIDLDRYTPKGYTKSRIKIEKQGEKEKSNVLSKGNERSGIQ